MENFGEKNSNVERTRSFNEDMQEDMEEVCKILSKFCKKKRLMFALCCVFPKYKIINNKNAINWSGESEALL